MKPNAQRIVEFTVAMVGALCVQTSALAADDASAPSKKVDRAVSAAERLVDQVTRVRDRLKPTKPDGTGTRSGTAAATRTAAATAADTAVAADGAAPGVAVAPRPDTGSGGATFDPLAPPKRLIGVQGVNLGATRRDAIALLKKRGWDNPATEYLGDDFQQDSTWQKGPLKLGFKTTPHASPEGRILFIVFVQKYKNPAEGQFDVNKLHDDLVAKFGPSHGKLPSITWYEGPPQSVVKAASLDQQVVMSRGPKLSALIARDSLRLVFNWQNLEMEPVRELLRRQKAEADSAPKKNAALE